MIDPLLVTRKINLIAKDLTALARYGQMTREQYLADAVNEAAAERYLERMIGRMIDINYHIVTELGDPPPKDYYESFTEMAKRNVLPFEFAQSIAQAAGLRNRIVHEYDEIDAGKVHQAIQDALKDIPRYIGHIQQFLQKLK